jgi:S1-C subfamily serine protease
LPASAQEASGLKAAAALESVLVDAIAKAEKSVVAIGRMRADSPPAADEDQPDFVPDGFGSGVVVDPKGLILTSYHVLGDVKNSRYHVWLQRKRYAATVKAADPWLDLAVLKIDAVDLVSLPLGDASALKKGQIVIALGNPYATARDGEPSASYGIVANLYRPAPAARSAGAEAPAETLHRYGNLIQTDCKLELGSSGGALVNLKGEMVGLTTSLAALFGYERAGGYAIPVDEHFRRAVESLKAGRMPEYGFLGVQPAILSVEERQRGLRGARIVHVQPGTPAAKAGLQVSDVVTHVDGRSVADHLELFRMLSGRAPGATITLTLERGGAGARPGRTVEVQAELSKKRIEARRPGFAIVTDPPWRGMKIEYATASVSFTEQSHALDPQGSVAVVEVERDSPAWKAGMRPGDFVTHVGQQRVATPQQFHAAVAGRQGDVVLRVAGAAQAERTIPAESPAAP